MLERLPAQHQTDGSGNDRADQQSPEQSPDEAVAPVALAVGVVPTGTTDRPNGDETTAVAAGTDRSCHWSLTSRIAVVTW
jgi:hypothetical protein